MIVVERAPPYLTIQDRGRFGYRASGVPVAGAMDQWSFARANQLVGNERNAAAFEWAIGAGTLRFTMDATIAITGAQVEAAIDDRAITSGSSIAVGAGELLSVKRLTDLRFIYIAVAGGLDCPEVLGSRSTYLPATLGGHEGRRLKTGDRIDVGASGTHSTSTDENVSAPDFRSDTLRVIAADSDSLDRLAQLTFRVSQMSDRMGYRLESQGDAIVRGASVTSEPVCPGTIQLPPDGQPIVLMADSPTIGGYRVVGAVISDDLPILAQCMPGRQVKFVSFE
jgi:antagonist of KipI